MQLKKMCEMNLKQSNSQCQSVDSPSKVTFLDDYDNLIRTKEMMISNEVVHSITYKPFNMRKQITKKSNIDKYVMEFVMNAFVFSDLH